MTINRRALLSAGLGAALSPSFASASEPVRIVVPFAAGAGTDVAARMLAQAWSTTSGRNVIVENKPGAGAVVASLEVAKSKPDGTTLLFNTGAHTTNAVLVKGLPFDPVNDFTPVTRIGSSPGFALFVASQSRFKTLKQLVDEARAAPGRLTYGSAGTANTTHVIGALFCKGVGIDLLHVPFKGTPANELIGGTIDSAFISPVIGQSWIRAGQIRALGISGHVRSALLPDVATFGEQGFEVADIPAWTGLWGPKHMSESVLRPLHDSLVKAGKDPKFAQFNKDNGGTVEMTSPQECKAWVDAEIARYRRILPPLGIQMS